MEGLGDVELTAAGATLCVGDGVEIAGFGVCVVLTTAGFGFGAGVPGPTALAIPPMMRRPANVPPDHASILFFRFMSAPFLGAAAKSERLK